MQGFMLKLDGVLRRRRWLVLAAWAALLVAKLLRDRLSLDAGARNGVAIHLIGQGALWAGLQQVSKTDLAKAESIGFPVVLLILVAVFGSFAAAALPLALGGVSVLVTGAA